LEGFYRETLKLKSSGMIIPRPPEEVGQSFRSDPAHPDKLHLSPGKSLRPVLPDLLGRAKEQAAKRPLDLFSPFPQNFWIIP